MFILVYPRLKMDDVVIFEGEMANMTCECRGNPNSTITWKKNNADVDDWITNTEYIDNYTVISNYSFRPQDTGNVTCAADNMFYVEKTANVAITDIEVSKRIIYVCNAYFRNYR